MALPSQSRGDQPVGKCPVPPLSNFLFNKGNKGVSSQNITKPLCSQQSDGQAGGQFFCFFFQICTVLIVMNKGLAFLPKAIL